MDPFAMALDAMFRAPGSSAAIYKRADGTVVPGLERVIRSRPDKIATFGESRIIEGTNLFEIQRKDVDQPLKGDTITIGAEVFRLLGEAMIDVEGMTWTIGGTEVL